MLRTSRKQLGSRTSTLESSPVPLIPRTIPAVGLKLPLQPRTVPAPGLQVLQHYRPAAIPGLHLRLQSRTASIMVAKKMENEKAWALQYLGIKIRCSMQEIVL